MTRIGLHLGWLAGASFVLAVILAASATPGYDHARHAVGLLGTTLAPHAAAFNAFGFVLSGLLLSAFAFAFERRLAAVSRAGRVATGLLAIAGLAFAAQGVFGFDPNDLDGPVSRRHVAAVSLALLAWFAALSLLASVLGKRGAWRGTAVVAGCAALTMLVLTLSPFDTLGGAGWTQRAQWALFFAWPAFAAWTALRRDQGLL